LKLSWEVMVGGGGVTVGSAGGQVQMTLLMTQSSSGSGSSGSGVVPWFGGGIVSSDALSMVSTSPSASHIVYMYLPSRHEVGAYALSGYSASAINTESQHRVDSGVVGVVTTSDSTAIVMQRSRLTGVEWKQTPSCC
jgi:hypothetical protein